MDEQQPELRWAPLPPAPRRKGRIWLIAGLAVAALAIVGLLLFFLLPRGESTTPVESQSPTPTATPSETPTPTPTPTASTEPTEPPVVTPPPVADPSLEAFRGQVGGWLNDAIRGLDIVAGAGDEDALPVVDTLQQDAQRLADAHAPSSIAQDWSDGVAAYARDLATLRSALSSGSGISAAIDDARAGAQSLRTLVGL